VHDKCTLLPFLIENLKGRSRSTVKSYLAHRQVAINGRVTTAFDAFLHAGDVVAVRNVGEEAANPNHLARIVYEDDDILVVDKKYGAAAAQNARRRGEQTGCCFWQNRKRHWRVCATTSCRQNMWR